jgi:hypothetical protein
MAPRRKSITPKYFSQGGISDKIPRIAYTANALRFQSEEDLEIYIENHFDELFPDLELLQRQFRLHSQRYDLLCRHKNTHQAVLIELKNEEDRSIVWQLIRYRHLILDKRPFPDQIDYSYPIELIAIAPSFNEDSLIDKAACKFEENIKLLKFSFTVEGKVLHLAGRKHIIPYSITGLCSEIKSNAIPNFTQIYNEAPALAKLLQNIPQENRDDFWHLRSLFLAQPKVKEIVNSLGSRVFYATSNREGSKTLAEIGVSDKQISLFLYLPSRHSGMGAYHVVGNPIKIKRFQIIFDETKNLFKLDENVRYLVLISTSSITLKERENLSVTFEKNRSIFGRDGMPKWCKGDNYLFQLSLGYNNKSACQELYTELVSANPTGWWQEFQTQETDKLSWFIDLAIRAWRYKI